MELLPDTATVVGGFSKVSFREPLLEDGGGVLAKPVGTATTSVVDTLKSPALRIKSPLKFLQGGTCPREARGAEKSKFLQRKMLMPVGLLHESPSQGRQGTPVSHPANIHRPAEDLANKNTRYLVGQGDPQRSRDAVANGL